MKHTFPALLLGLALLPYPALSAAPSSSEYHIVLPRRAIAAGERITLRLVPPVHPGVHTLWWVYEGSSGIGLQPYATFTAPYVIPVGTPPARVTAALTGPGVKATVATEIELKPGSVPGAEGCLGPDQRFSTVTGIIDLGNAAITTSALLVHRVDPDYPKSAIARGVEDTITVMALVCRTGRVLDAYVPSSYVGLDPQPTEQDPRLIESALRAVRQYGFRPATSGENAIASWVVTPVQFRR